MTERDNMIMTINNLFQTMKGEQKDYERRTKTMLDRDNMIMTINNSFQTIFDYQDKIDYLNSKIEKITEDTVRNAAKAKLIHFEELVHELEAEVIILVANVLVNRSEERTTEQDGKTDEKGISPSKEQDGKTEEK